jgi:hypothetical protein
MPGGFKGTVFKKNRMGVCILAFDKQFNILIFWHRLKKLLSAYMGWIKPKNHLKLLSL